MRTGPLTSVIRLSSAEQEVSKGRLLPRGDVGTRAGGRVPGGAGGGFNFSLAFTRESDIMSTHSSRVFGAHGSVVCGGVGVGSGGVVIIPPVNRRGTPVRTSPHRRVRTFSPGRG